MTLPEETAAPDPRARAPSRLVRSGVVNGLAFALAAGLVDAAAYGGLAVMGVGSREVEQVAQRHFLPDIVGAVAAVAAAYVVVFVLGGLVARALHALAFPPRRTARLVVETFAIQLALHAFALAYTAAYRPAALESGLSTFGLGAVLRAVASPAGRIALGLATALAVAALARAGLRRRVAPRAAASIALASGLVAGAAALLPMWRVSPPELPRSTAAGSPKHVVLLAIDSLRGDRLALEPARPRRCRS